ncbi:MAG TPA: NnrU family protein [Casimicrobiaceae bacterium]
MGTLIAGLVVFLLSHALRIFAPGWRERQVARMGPGPYKIAYSVVSIVGLVLVVWGYGMARANPVVLWPAPAWGRHATALLTVVGFILVVAAYVPGTRIKAALGHPMTAGVGLWAIGHLAANGSLAAVVLFGAFLAWAVVLFVTRRAQDRAAGTTYPAGSLSRDATVVVVGIVAALAFALFLHGPLIGVRPFG